MLCMRWRQALRRRQSGEAVKPLSGAVRLKSMVLSVTGKGCKSSQVSDQELNESERADEVSITHTVQLKPEYP